MSAAELAGAATKDESLRLRFMDLYEVMRTTAAVRDSPDDGFLDEVLIPFSRTSDLVPSGGNLEGAQIVVVRDPVTRDRLVEITEPGARRYHAQPLRVKPRGARTPPAGSPRDS